MVNTQTTHTSTHLCKHTHVNIGVCHPTSWAHTPLNLAPNPNYQANYLLLNQMSGLAVDLTERCRTGLYTEVIERTESDTILTYFIIINLSKVEVGVSLLWLWPSILTSKTSVLSCSLRILEAFNSTFRALVADHFLWGIPVLFSIKGWVKALWFWFKPTNLWVHHMHSSLLSNLN